MYEARWDLLEFRNPMFDVSSFRVVVLRLSEHVEFILAAARQCSSKHPVAPVLSRVVVEELTFEMIGTSPPVHIQVKYEERCNILASSVGHEASLQ